jgi:four helix bundle protein
VSLRRFFKERRAHGLWGTQDTDETVFSAGHQSGSSNAPGFAARTIGALLIRLGTSVGANYRAALRARSRKEFVARIAVVVEEADETCYWLELMAEGGILPARKLGELMTESDELTAIFTAIRKTTGPQKRVSRTIHKS